MGAIRIIVIAAALLVLTSPRLWAAELKQYTFEDTEKKVLIKLRFDGPVTAEVLSHYTNNFVGLKIAGLKFSKAQLKGNHGSQVEPTGQFFRYLQCKSVEGAGEIRLYLGKLATPADAQVIQLEERIEVEIIKPLWKLDPGEGTTPPPEFIPDEPESGGTITAPPVDPAPPSAAPPAEGGGWNNGAGEPPAEPEGFVPGPSYKQFDLDDVPIAQLEIKGQPFDEALVALVANSGFNVVVGDGVDETQVNLSFTQRGLSLKAALDLLCIAYDLVYTVEDDAIVVKPK